METPVAAVDETQNQEEENKPDVQEPAAEEVKAPETDTKPDPIVEEKQQSPEKNDTPKSLA